MRRKLINVDSFLEWAVILSPIFNTILYIIILYHLFIKLNADLNPKQTVLYSLATICVVLLILSNSLEKVIKDSTKDIIKAIENKRN